MFEHAGRLKTEKVEIISHECLFNLILSLQEAPQCSAAAKTKLCYACFRYVSFTLGNCTVTVDFAS
jgi:hypothetical protein